MQHLTDTRILQEIHHNEKLKRCLLYARAAVRDPLTRKYYKALAKRRQTAFNAAFIDAYYPPKIIGIVLDYFSGKIGDPIIVRVTDCYHVREVRIKLISENGNIIEQAVCCRQKNRKDFIFTVKKDISRLNGVWLKIMAFDIPMNITCVKKLFYFG